jgi:mRNA interferase RelE/StbE
MFKVFIARNALSSIPNERREQIKNALKELESPSEGGNIKKLKGHKTELFRLRIGDYRAFYTIDFENKIVKVLEILTAEQAHKKYDRLI